MAIQKIYEPRTRVQEVIREYPTLLNIDGTCNIGGVIVAPTGPRLSFISGPEDFMEKYTVDGKIPRNADITFLNAYYLSFSAGLVLARAMNTKAVGGLYFSTEALSLYKLFIELIDQNLWCVNIGEKYYFYNDKSTKWKDFMDRLRNKTEDETAQKYYDKLEEDEVEEEDTVYVKNLLELAEAINEDESLGDPQVSYDTFSGALVSKIDLYASGPNDPTLQYNVTFEDGGVQNDGVMLKAKNILFKDNIALTKKYDIEFNFTDDDGTFNKSFAFTFGQMAYYHGAIDKSLYSEYSLMKVDTVGEVLASINGFAGIAAEYLKESDSSNENSNAQTESLKAITVWCSEGNEIYAEDGCSPTGEPYGAITPSQDWENAHPEYSKDTKLLEVYPDDPQEFDNYKISISPDDGNLFYMTVKNPKDESNTYEVSLLSDGLDSAGVNAYIENLNTLGIGMTFTVNQDYKYDADTDPGEASIEKVLIKVNQAWSFGDSGLSIDMSKDITCKINALYELEDQELFDIEYLAPLGETDLQFIKNYTLVGKNNYWLTPVDIPWNRTNKNSIKQYFMNVDNSSNIIAMGPFDKNIGLTGWQFKLAASTLYYTKIMSNRAARSEYAAVFDITNGVLDYTNPYYLLGEDERTALLNFKCPVNFVKFDQRSDVYYFNDNRTHQSKLDPVSEEENRRLINRINKDLKRILDPFKGRMNTETTRLDVCTVIDRYFEQFIMNQNYKPDAYARVCDESNNTPDIINANKLKVWVGVRVNNAIKYIDVLDEVFPLGVAFTE